MAVQKSKKSRSKRDMRRSHHGAKPAAYSVDSTTGELHLRHNMTESGYYRGKQVVRVNIKTEESQDEESAQ